MPLTLNPTEARKADRYSSVIREPGKYVCTITRAERLLSEKGTEGVGLSLKSDDGSSANFLDVYTVGRDGKILMGNAIIQALLCCLKLRGVSDGEITFEAWDNQARSIVKRTAPGYPDLMGKRIGVVLRKELQTNDRTGDDVERLTIVGVFQADTGLMSTEILDNKTKAELLPKMVQWVTANPIKDSRKKGNGYQRAATNAMPGREDGDPGATDSDIPFN